MGDTSAHSITWIMITIVYFSALYFYRNKDKLKYPYASLFILVFILVHELLWILNYFIYLCLFKFCYFDITLLAPYSYYAILLTLAIPKLNKEKEALIFAFIFTLSYQEIWLVKWHFVNSAFWIPYSNFDNSLRTHIIEISDWIGYALMASLILLQNREKAT
jgi:membrane-associated HD superfamily phosphohydrolase